MKRVFYCIGMVLWLFSVNVFAMTEEEALIQTAIDLSDEAFDYYQQGNYPQALKWFQASLTIRENILGKQHPDIAESYNNIGLIYNFMGDYPKALDFYQKSLAIQEKVLDKQHPNTATSYNNIGAMYDSMGNYPKALEFKQKALAIEKKVLGKQHPATTPRLSHKKIS